MIRSSSRILTTHAGALPRAPELREMIFARAEGKPHDRNALSARLRSEVAEVVRRQAACGIDSVNDGEVGKTNFTNYVRERLAGFEMRDYRPGVDPAPLNITARDSKDFPQYFAGGKGALTGAAQRRQLAVCVAPLRYVGRAALEWSTESDQVETGLLLGGALWRFWETRGYLGEGRTRLGKLLAVAGEYG